MGPRNARKHPYPRHGRESRGEPHARRRRPRPSAAAVRGGGIVTRSGAASKGPDTMIPPVRAIEPGRLPLMSQAQSPRRLLCGLALVLAACGDSRAPEHVMDVALQHALRATLTPGEAAIALDGSADFEVTVSGGADGPDSMWRCAVTNPEVASAAVTPTGCRASALTAGGAAIRATVTRGSETTSTTARLTVNAVPARGCPGRLADVDGAHGMRGAHAERLRPRRLRPGLLAARG